MVLLGGTFHDEQKIVKSAMDAIRWPDDTTHLKFLTEIFKTGLKF